MPLQVSVPADTALVIALYEVASPPVQLPAAEITSSRPDGIAGVVSDATTQAGIAGATVQLLDSDGNELAEVATDDNGAFALANLSPATDAVVVSAQGYSTSDLSQVSVPADTGLVVTLLPIPTPPDAPTNVVSGG
jgi:hypothetical protein